MPKPSEKDRVGTWDSKVATSTKDHEDWEKLFECDELELYREGLQRKGSGEEDGNRRGYIVNMFYPSINIAMPSMLFSLPVYKVTPRPMRMADEFSDVEARAKLQEQTLNTFVQSPQVGFSEETELAILDAQFRFGVAQVGYTADFIDNPNAGKPILNDDDSEMLDESGATVKQGASTIQSEGLFIKYIPAKQCRVAAHSKNRTTSCDWFGYYEWHHVEDVKNNPNYKNTDKLKATGKLKDTPKEETANEDSRPGMVKVWFVWDFRSKHKRVWAQGGEKFFQEKPFKFFPCAILKFDQRLGKWLPLPPTFNWKPPQDELNDTREMQRVHRLRALRKYLMRPDALGPEEIAKLKSTEDMEVITANGTNLADVLVPVQDAPLDSAVFRNVPQSVEDFIRVSGISGEDQQIADSQTATQANIIAMAGKLRDKARQLIVAKWLSEIGRIMLLTLRENMALPFWIKMAVDEDSPHAAEMAKDVAYLWKQIENDDLGNIDNDVAVDISSLSPMSQPEERADFIQFLGLATSPNLAAVLSGSPVLLKKLASLFNITSERDIQAVSEAMQAAALMFAQAAAQKAGGGQSPPAPGPTPTNPQIGQQLDAQMPVEAGQIQ